MDVQKECPCSQRHHTRRLDEAATESGVQSVFFSQSHCAAISGNFVCRSFSPVRTAFPAQIGQPLPPLVREEILVLQLCQFGHIHQTRREVPGSTCSGVSGAFFS